MLRYAVRLAVAAFVAVAGLGVPAAAQAASCSTSHGVTVVVDFHQLGGGAQAACDTGGAGRSGAQQMGDMGYRLTYVQRQPGFVCRVNGAPVPADDPCVNTPPGNAYWSLWWSDGTSGTWSYSAEGIGALEVPDGGYVALSWQGGDAKAPPRVAPKAHPVPSSSPTHRPSSQPATSPPSTRPATPPAVPTSEPTSGSPSPTGTAHRVRSSHRPTRAASGLGTPLSASRSPDSTQATEATPRAVDEAGDAGGLPGWVAPVAVLALLGSAAAVAVVRRKRAGGA